ncbi:MAG: thioredoxin family protein [Puniceicoccales bacterium]|jgi:hypothetical protein|nr:thioredoxin family protein [Puniceicoccales bacterium]
MRSHLSYELSLVLLLSAALLSGCSIKGTDSSDPMEDDLDVLDKHVVEAAREVPETKPVPESVIVEATTPPIAVTEPAAKSDLPDKTPTDGEKTKETVGLLNPTPVTPPQPVPAAAPAVSMVISWLTDMEDAKRQAAQSGKDILVAFVANDSFPWSQRLDADVFSRPAFAVIANKSFVFVMVDFPKTYSLTPEQAKKNTELRKNWGVRSFPTVILADAHGRPYAVTGYRNVGAADYARHLESLLQVREQRDQYFSAAYGTEGMSRAIMLSQGLRLMDEDVVLRHYKEELSELRYLDPMDATGLSGDIEFTPKLDSLREKVVRLIRQQKDYDGALKAVDDFIVYEAPIGEHLQKALFLKLNVYANPNPEVQDHGAVIKLMDQIIAINPLSEQGMMAVDVRARANALIAGPKMTPKQE